MQLTYKDLQSFSEKIAKEAGKLLVTLQSTAEIAKKKDAYGDIATTADLASEKLLINAIEASYKHNIFSEEAGLIDHHSDFTWYIDPLDGTKEYARGLYRYAVLVSCQTSQELVASAAYFPRINLLYSASKGNGAYLDQSPLQVSSQSKLTHSYIFGRLPGNNISEPEFSRSWDIHQQLAQKAYKFRPCNFEAEVLCWVAQGAAEALVVLGDYGPKWWDVASGLMIAQEAGATITNRYGKPLKLQNLEDGLVVTNGKIHQQLISLIN